MKTLHAQSSRRKRLRQIALISAVLLLIAALQYSFTRWFADRNAVRIRELQTSAEVSPATFQGTLRLATFNIAHGRGTNESNLSNSAERRVRLKQIAGLLKEKNVDIAVLNEVDFASVWTGHEDQAEIIAREAGFTHIMEQRNFDVAVPFIRLKFGNAVLSRFPIQSAALVKLPPLSSRERRFAGAKQGAIVDIRLDPQTTIRIFPVHLDPRSETTRGESTSVMARCAAESPHPFFCLGDFNSCPGEFAAAQNAGRTWSMDTLLKDGRSQTLPKTQPGPEQLTFASFDPLITIDWILVPADWTFASHEVTDIELSDHRPVFAEVRKPVNPSDPQR